MKTVSRKAGKPVSERRHSSLIPLTGLLTLSLSIILLTGCVSTADGKKPLFVAVATNELGQVTYDVNPGINHAIRTGQQIGQQVLPAPWGALLTGALGLTTAGLGWLAKRKSAEAALVPALIAGVEEGNDADTKQKIQTAAKAAGVSERLHRVVQKITG